MRAVAGIAIGLFAVGALFLALQEGEEDPHGYDVEKPAPTQDDAPTLLGAGTDTPVPKTAGAGTAMGSKPDEKSASQAPAFHVEGRIEGLTPQQLEATHVRVHLLGSFDWVNRAHSPATTTPGKDGRFRVDAGALRKKVPSARRMQVSVDHPEFMVANMSLAMAPLEAREQQIAEPFQVVRARRLVVIVHDPDGEPVKEANVVLVPMDGDRPAETTDDEVVLADKGTTDAEGRIVLRAPAGGPALLAANLYPHLPASERLLIEDDDLTPHILRLGRASAISGRVTINGRTIGAASLSAMPRPSGDHLDFGAFMAAWHEGGLAPGQLHVSAGEDGRFEIRGLAARTHILTVGGFTGYRLISGPETSCSREVEAPAQGVQLDVSAAVVSIRVVSGTEPVKGASVMVGRKDKGYSGSVTDKDGILRFLLPAGPTYEATVKHKRFTEEQKLELTGLNAGDELERIVDLGPRRAEGTLVVVLQDPAGKPIRKTGFRLSNDESGHVSGFDEGLGLKENKDGIFRLDGLSAGSTTLIVTPGRGPSEHSGRFLALIEKIVIRAERETRVELTALRGARLSLLVTDEAGVPLEASATLKDGRGQQIEVTYLWSDENSATMSNGGPGAQRSSLDPPLAPGPYEITCSASGYVSETVSFVAEADTDKELTVQLRSK